MPISKETLLVLLVFVMVASAVLAVSILIRAIASYRGKVRSRLKAPGPVGINSREELIRVRRNRGLSSEGDYSLPLYSLNELLMQSGTSLGVWGLMGWMIATAIFTHILLQIGGVATPYALGLAIVLAVIGPLFIVRELRDQRRRKFEEQLPDGIDVLVRSLRVGHSIPVAIGAVGRHMPDPVGAEFTLTAAEMTYGLDLETAMVNLRSRVGHPDLALIVLAVSIQARTGGNLAEILSNLARVIRARLKLRRKARALSVEGRYSAILLSALPIALFLALKVISPGYYGDVWDNPYVKPILAGAIVWMMIGDYVMYRMVRIKI